MVISFQSDAAFNFLMKHGMVFTFRRRERQKLGPDWVNRGRGLPKVREVVVHLVGKKEPARLLPYVRRSGFTSLEAWHEEIARLSKVDKLPPDFCGWLYRVELQ